MAPGAGAMPLYFGAGLRGSAGHHNYVYFCITPEGHGMPHFPLSKQSHAPGAWGEEGTLRASHGMAWRGMAWHGKSNNPSITTLIARPCLSRQHRT